MQFGILITNNITGNHPADKWAEVTVGRIMAVFDIDPDSGSEEAKQGRRDKRVFEAQLLDIVEKYHQAVHDKEQEALKAEGGMRLHTPIHAEHHVSDLLDGCTAEIVAAAKINPRFAAYFANSEVQRHVRDDMLAVDFTCAIHANRLGHCDLNPNDHHVAAWKKGCEEHGPGVGHHFMQRHLHPDLRSYDVDE